MFLLFRTYRVHLYPTFAYNNAYNNAIRLPVGRRRGRRRSSRVKRKLDLTSKNNRVAGGYTGANPNTDFYKWKHCTNKEKKIFVCIDSACEGKC